MHLRDIKFKSIGGRIGGGGGPDRFDPNAEDGDGDQIVQDSTRFERPATPRAPRSRGKKPSPNLVKYGIPDSIVEMLYKRVKEDKGFTIYADNGKEQKTGLAVALDPDVAPTGLMSEADWAANSDAAKKFIRDWLIKNADAFDSEGGGGTHIGAWVDEIEGVPTVFIDAVTIMKRSPEAVRRLLGRDLESIQASRERDSVTDEAVKQAKERNQIGIWDIDVYWHLKHDLGKTQEEAAKGAYIETGGTGFSDKCLLFENMELKVMGVNRNGIVTTENSERPFILDVKSLRSEIKNRRRNAAVNARALSDDIQRNTKTRSQTPIASERYDISVGSLSDIISHHYKGDPAQIATKRFALDFCATETKGKLARVLIPGSSAIFRNPTGTIARRTLSPGGNGLPGGGGVGGGGVGGGGLGRTIGKVPITSHCPTGFQFGGRFSDRQLSNCGEQLFVAPDATPKGPKGEIVRLQPLEISPDKPKLTKFGIVGGADLPLLSATISRAANIDHVGAANTGNSDSAVTEALSVASRNAPPFTRLIRRDGVPLDSRVSIDRLASQPANVDMQGGTIVSAVSDVGTLGNSEIGLFKAGISSIRFAVPGGNEIRVDAPNPLTAADKRNITQQWASIRKTNTPDNGAAPLQQLVAQSNGKLTYSETFNGIDKPNEMVSLSQGKSTRTVPRWVAESFLTSSAPGRKESSEPWKMTGVQPTLGGSSAITRSALTLDDATKMLKENKPLSEIPVAFRPNAISRSKSFESVEIGGGRNLLTRANGEKFISREGPSSSIFADKVSSDLMKAAGIATPEVLIGGTGSKRTAFTSPAESAVPQGVLSVDKSLSDVNLGSLSKIALMDYVLAQSDRSPSSVAIVSDGKNLIPVPSSNGTSLLSSESYKPGSASTIAAIVRKPQEILVTDSSWMRENVLGNGQNQNIEDIVSKSYEALVKSLSSFDWEAYAARLGADGSLSPADKQHLDVIKNLVSSRLANLKSSRKRLAQILGSVQ